MAPDSGISGPLFDGVVEFPGQHGHIRLIGRAHHRAWSKPILFGGIGVKPFHVLRAHKLALATNVFHSQTIMLQQGGYHYLIVTAPLPSVFLIHQSACVVGHPGNGQKTSYFIHFSDIPGCFQTAPPLPFRPQGMAEQGCGKQICVVVFKIIEKFRPVPTEAYIIFNTPVIIIVRMLPI